MLGDDAWVDFEAASRLEPSTLEITSRGFLTGDEAPWIEERRRDVAELRLRALEAIAADAPSRPRPSAPHASWSRRRRFASPATGC